MHGITARIRELLEREIPALRALIDEADSVIGDLEAGIDRTPVSPRRALGPAGPVQGTNRAPLSPLPAARRGPWAAERLRATWDPFRGRLLDHLEREERAVYPLALRVLEGEMAHRRHLATPIVQMVAENEALRGQLPGLRQALYGVDGAARQVNRVIVAYERLARAEEIEVFPGLLQLADGAFNLTTTPLQTRHRAGPEVSRALRRRGRGRRAGLLARIKAWWG